MIALSIALAYVASLSFVLAWRRWQPQDAALEGADQAHKAAMHAVITVERLEKELRERDAATTQSEGARALALAEQLMARWQPAAEDMAEMRKLVNTLALERGLKIAPKAPQKPAEPAKG